MLYPSKQAFSLISRAYQVLQRLMQITHFLILFISVKTLDTDQPKLGKKMFAYNKYAKFYNLEPYGTTVPNNFQIEIQILSSTKSFSLKN